ncbi:histidine kinase [Metabacillus rhizolycopersici]|uniref:histidine kinase n=1 Tax=Metabacillus rhizolycopersici TaxID=2875709 RepID=A0ABS7UWJ7_9BACI|nr:histidine kinase [Metabacillus rhizolycopersici]MBZ5752653.1 histidine kinase [Metabacillus rhizolycopersici]
MRTNFNKTYQLFVVLSIILSIYMTFLNIKYPYVGATVQINHKDEIIITNIEPKSWAEKIGIEIGDVLIEVNDADPLEHRPVKDQGVIEQVESFTLSREGINKEYSVSNSAIINTQSLLIIIIPFTVLTLCLFCSFYIYKSNKGVNLKSANLLNLFLLIISMAYISATGSSKGDEISRYVNLCLFLLVPVSYLHFLYQYFNELGKKLFNFNFVKFGYSLVFFNLAAEISQKILLYNFNFNRLINLSSFFIMLILTFVLKFTGLKKIRYSEQSYLVKILIVTNILAFSPFLLFYVLPYLIFQKYVFPPTFLAAFLLLIPFSLVYQFLATKIYDIEFLLGRIRYYALLAIVPTFVLVGIMLNLKESNPNFYQIKLSIFVYIALLFVFYMKEIFDFRFRLKRFSEKYNYQDSIFKYTQSISKSSNLEQVVSELKQVIVDVLLVSKAYFIEVDREEHLTSIDVNAKESDYGPYVKQIRKATNEIGKIVEIDRGFVINVGETEDKSYVLLCLSILNTPRLTRDEISWLKTLSFYTNVSLENFLKIDELMQHLQRVETEGQNPGWLNKLLFSIEEKQRSNLAKDLHDSVLQDLVSLKRQCEIALVDVNVDSTQLKKQLSEMSSSMTKIIKTTRETCQELRPQLLYDLGLVKALNKLVLQYQDIVDFDIRLNTGNFIVNLDIDTQLNIYRIVQELLTNAQKHSKASQVLIILVCIKDKIVLHYEDNGIGFDYSDQNDKTESMGLSGISERVKALKGSININTSIGNGVKIDVEI